MENSGRCFITEALSAIFMPKIEYRTSLLSNEERFFISDELCQGGLSMPNPTKISLPRINYRFIASACVPVLTVMLNKVEKDYSTVDELCDHDELSKFSHDEIKKAVTELCSRKFLLEVEKPYGCVYRTTNIFVSIERQIEYNRIKKKLRDAERKG